MRSSIKNGALTDLGTLGGIYRSAGAINNSGEVAGTAAVANGDEHAFVYSEGVMKDLNSLIVNPIGGLVFD